MTVTSAKLRSELQFSTSRSGGPGGQHVNKVESRVMLMWDILNSKLIGPEDKTLLLQRLQSRLTSAGVLVLTTQESRSQASNRKLVLQKLDNLLAGALRKRKVRRPTKATAASKQNRLQSKKAHGERKKWRQRPGG